MDQLLVMSWYRFLDEIISVKSAKLSPATALQGAQSFFKLKNSGFTELDRAGSLARQRPGWIGRAPRISSGERQPPPGRCSRRRHAPQQGAYGSPISGEPRPPLEPVRILTLSAPSVLGPWGGASVDAHEIRVASTRVFLPPSE